MIASVHIADIGFRSALRVLRRSPRPASISGMRDANVALAARFTSSPRPSPDFGRVGLVAFWDDDEALDRFLAESPLAATLVRLRLTQAVRFFRTSAKAEASSARRD